jgi:hypothetical protein
MWMDTFVSEKTPTATVEIESNSRARALLVFDNTITIPSKARTCGIPIPKTDYVGECPLILTANPISRDGRRILTS